VSRPRPASRLQRRCHFHLWFLLLFLFTSSASTPHCPPASALYRRICSPASTTTRPPLLPFELARSITVSPSSSNAQFELQPLAAAHDRWVSPVAASALSSSDPTKCTMSPPLCPLLLAELKFRSDSLSSAASSTALLGEPPSAQLPPTSFPWSRLPPRQLVVCRAIAVRPYFTEEATGGKGKKPPLFGSWATGRITQN
jgi:hypothetical protein